MADGQSIEKKTVEKKESNIGETEAEISPECAQERSTIIQKDFMTFLSECHKHATDWMQDYIKTREKCDTVSIKSKDNLFKGKYTRKCRFDRKYQPGMRGLTCITNDKKEIIRIAHCLDKFENVYNVKNIYGIEWQEFLEILEEQKFSFKFVPKYDGSCIMMFFHDDQCYAHTLGSLDDITMQKKEDDSPAFGSHAIKLVKEQYPDIFEFLKKNQDYVMVFELVTPWNKIVTKYDFTKNKDGYVFPLMSINKDGFPTWEVLKDICQEFKSGFPNESWDFTSKNWLKIRDECFKELESKITDPEGLVAYACKESICIPIAKLKRDDYLQKHGSVVLETGTDKDMLNIQKRYLEEKIDDIDLSNNQKNHVKEFEAGLEIAKKMVPIDEIKKLMPFDTKDKKAMYAKVNKDCIFKHFLFFAREDSSFFDSDDWFSKLLLMKMKNGSIAIDTLHEFYGPYWWIKK